jgi:hypothetical protein
MSGRSTAFAMTMEGGGSREGWLCRGRRRFLLGLLAERRGWLLLHRQRRQAKTVERITYVRMHLLPILRAWLQRSTLRAGSKVNRGRRAPTRSRGAAARGGGWGVEVPLLPRQMSRNLGTLPLLLSRSRQHHCPQTKLAPMLSRGSRHFLRALKRAR